jgi:hypothetical protein
MSSSGTHNDGIAVKQTDPIFIAEFEDGHQICTAVFCPPNKLDPARGVLLARRAYTRLRNDPLPPSIVRARFEFNSKMLATYNATALEAA